MKALLYIQLLLMTISITSTASLTEVGSTFFVPPLMEIQTVHCGYLPEALVEAKKNSKHSILLKKPKIDHEPLIWYMFEDSTYNLEVTKWSERDKILFTNVLKSESGSYRTDRRYIIDQYLVAVCAYRRFLERTGHKVTVQKSTRLEFVGSIPMEAYTIPVHKNKVNEMAWNNCYEIISNVINNTIPEWVPFIPRGTYAYIREEHCTAMWWVGRLKDPKVHTKVAHTIKGHQYFTQLKYNPGMKSHKTSQSLN